MRRATDRAVPACRLWHIARLREDAARDGCPPGPELRGERVQIGREHQSSRALDQAASAVRR